ncbi:ABC transporter substrate-binding protein [Labrys sp. LIt4]|uniref:ABC transporter substrate-binding protein n=1 Tax=Labrys okinawensis TaxID=346911 RepID=A0A2S9QA80_9HYPH|nr:MULTISPECIES: ABC transporter substrate-binding protein [Labrys]MBP0582217.1 ABC transporter substrate-binding protein [Labrys sp. LIt4]PRH86244.1 ABC transporter substrate-binding protein [Labrys okinawensis]
MSKLLKTGLLAAGFAALLGTTAMAATKTLVYCSEGSPENFTPALNTTGTSLDAARPVYNQLVEFAPGTTDLRPGLAEKWDVSKDGTEIVFHLRKGVKFHSWKGFKPTRDFNADDVLFSFNRQWKDDNAYHKVSGGSYDYFNDMDMPGLLKSIEKVDDYTVKMTLTKPNAPFMANLGMDFATIHSAEYADFLQKAGTPEKFDQEPVGTGPFQFVAYQKDAVIRYKAFPQYWNGKVKLDQLVYAITPDAAARYAKLQKNECQVMVGPNPSDLKSMEANKDIKVLTNEGLNDMYFSFNTEKPPLDKKEVRLALAKAINLKAILSDVYEGSGKPSTTLIPSFMLGYNDKIPEYGYDPEASKKLLADAGVKTPIDIDLWYMPVYRPYNPNGKRMGELMQADLAKIGVNAKLVTYEWGDYRKRLQNGEASLPQMGWTGDNGDPDNFFFLFACDIEKKKPVSQNYPRWCNKDHQERLEKARASFDKAERTKLYQEMLQIAHDEVPYLNIAHTVVYTPVRKNVEGFKPSPLGRFEFFDTDLKK